MVGNANERTPDPWMTIITEHFVYKSKRSAWVVLTQGSRFYAASFNQIPLPRCRFGDYRDKEGNILKSLSSPRLQVQSPRPIMLEASAVSDPSRSGICVSKIHSKIRYIKGFRASQALDGTGLAHPCPSR